MDNKINLNNDYKGVIIKWIEKDLSLETLNELDKMSLIVVKNSLNKIEDTYINHLVSKELTYSTNKEITIDNIFMYLENENLGLHNYIKELFDNALNNENTKKTLTNLFDKIHDYEDVILDSSKFVEENYSTKENNNLDI